MSDARIPARREERDLNLQHANMVSAYAADIDSDEEPDLD
jgi:hypothetical protein